MSIPGVVAAMAAVRSGCNQGVAVRGGHGTFRVRAVAREDGDSVAVPGTAGAVRTAATVKGGAGMRGAITKDVLRLGSSAPESARSATSDMASLTPLN